MVKGLSCRKIAAVNIYSGKLYQSDLRLHVKIFHTIIFPGNIWRTFSASGILVLKKLLIPRIKDIIQTVQAEFLKFQNQVKASEWIQIRICPTKKKKKERKDKRLLKLSAWYVSKRFQMFLWRQFWNRRALAARREKEGELANTSLEFEFLHWKSRVKWWLAEMTLKMSLAIGACFHVFFNVCLNSSSFSLLRKSTSSIDGMPQGGGIKILETHLH